MTESHSRYQAYGWPAPTAVRGWTLSTLVSPSQLFGSNGLRFDAGGRLWIAQADGDQLGSYDPSAGVFRVEAAVGRIVHPDDLAFATAGEAYVTQPAANSVSRLDPDGAVSVLADDCPAANGITVAPDGRLFVDECRPGGRLLEIMPGPPVRCRVVTGDLAMPNALEMGPDGRLYLPEVGADRVLAVDADTGATGIAVEGVEKPSAVKFDPLGRLVVSEATTGRLHWVDLSDGSRGILAIATAGADNFAFDRRGDLYVSNFVSGSLHRFDAGDGHSTVVHAPGLLGPYGIAASGDGVVVADSLSIAFAGPGGQLHRLSQIPNNQAFAAVAITVTVDGVVVALSREGELWIGELSSSALRGPLRPAGKPNGVRVCALAAWGPRVLIGDELGVVTVLEADGTPGATMAGGLGPVRALGVAVDGEAAGTVVAATGAADSAGGRLVVDVAGRSAVVDGIGDPAAVVFSAGTLVVADRASGQVIGVDLGSGRLTPLAAGMPFGSPVPGTALRARPSLAALPDGTLLVGCPGDGSIRRLRPSSPHDF